ncbi:hypothetical protein [Methylocella silvestris]|uniref:Uncharacterized protein n=1 Tax=Methylocella silvestris TaxID=199596 RepID=A0A2J7TCF2_METSI|nr:hypothetical protein [Methylocella silvestris]PNG24442.1 hypothetical protein CR492_18645 [Methylocella silvestris]
MHSLNARRLRGGALCAAVIALVVGVAGSAGATEADGHHAAKARHHTAQSIKPNEWYGLASSGVDSGGAGASLSRIDRANYDHSGTRGREGLGESPFYPEGPGNVSD